MKTFQTLGFKKGGSGSGNQVEWKQTKRRREAYLSPNTLSATWGCEDFYLDFDSFE